MSSEKRSKAAGEKPPKGSYQSASRGTSDRARASGQTSQRNIAVPPGQADVAEIARAVSTGFTILILGGLIQPIVSRFVPWLGLIWLILVAIVAFAYTGFRAGRAGPKPPLFGGGAAVGAYVLVLPVLFLVGTFDPTYAASSLAAAVVVGALAGIIGARTNASD